MLAAPEMGIACDAAARPPGVVALGQRALAPLDGVRAAALRAFGRRGRTLLVSRDARVLLYAAAACTVALALAFAAPLWLMVVGPIVLGVPHLVADVRYLVARPGLHRRRGLVVLAGAPLAVTLVWPSAAAALLAVVGVAIAARGSRVRRAAVAAAGAAGAAGAYALGGTLDVIAAHAHNLVALALWWLLARRTARHAAPLALVAAGFAIIALAPAAWLPVAALDDLGRFLAPVGDPVWAARIVIAFAFAQSVHYAVWLRLVPEDARERPGIRSFASSLRALVRDLGGWAVVVAVIAAVMIAAVGCVDAHAARAWYLRAAFFHGYLELAVLALVAIEGSALLRRQREPRA